MLFVHTAVFTMPKGSFCVMNCQLFSSGTNVPSQPSSGPAPSGSVRHVPSLQQLLPRPHCAFCVHAPTKNGSGLLMSPPAGSCTVVLPVTALSGTLALSAC